MVLEIGPISESNAGPYQGIDCTGLYTTIDGRSGFDDVSCSQPYAPTSLFFNSQQWVSCSTETPPQHPECKKSLTYYINASGTTNFCGPTPPINFFTAVTGSASVPQITTASCSINSSACNIGETFLPDQCACVYLADLPCGINDPITGLPSAAATSNYTLASYSNCPNSTISFDSATLQTTYKVAAMLPGDLFTYSYPFGSMYNVYIFAMPGDTGLDLANRIANKINSAGIGSWYGIKTIATVQSLNNDTFPSTATLIISGPNDTRRRGTLSARRLQSCSSPLNRVTTCPNGSAPNPSGGCTTATPSPTSPPAPSPASPPGGGNGTHTCITPYEIDATGICKFTYTAKIACNDGISTGIPGAASSSSVINGSLIHGTTSVDFGSLLNKKLACCLNKEVSSGQMNKLNSMKYDCEDNSQLSATDFNTLWSSSDVINGGGQINAFILASGGKPITGFYSLDGIRCDRFSEFAGPLQAYTVDPLIKSAQQNSVGSTPIATYTISAPTNALAYSALSTTLVAARKSIPSTQADMNQCPILVRAALVVSCPPVKATTSLGRTYLDSVTANGKIYCPTASTISVKIQIEQIYAITGRPVMPIYSTISSSLAPVLNLNSLINSKYGQK